MLAIAINASPQRLQRFKELQAQARKIGMVQDVKTRWGSTYDMIARALLLRKPIYRWIMAEGANNKRMLVLKIDKGEWLQLQWLQDVLKPFKTWTLALSSSTGATIQNAWFAYQNINKHMRKMEAVMLRKNAPWAAELAAAITAGMRKLAAYWKGGNSPEARIYNLAVILSPSQKLSIYKVCCPPLADCSYHYPTHLRQCTGTAMFGADQP